MSLLRSAFNDSVIIHPPGFYIFGFQTFPYISIYFIFIVFVYVVTVLFNFLIIYVIVFNHSLHTPKFMAVANLAVIDLILNTCTIPGMIKIFLVKDNFIPFNLCLLQMFVYYTCACLESYALAILAYDRLIAICFPLRQHSINTLRSMISIVTLTWSMSVGISAFSVIIMTRLSFCKSVRVFSYFCDYAPVFRLACNDYSLQWFVASLSSILILTVPFIFIILTYITILLTVFSMKSLDSRAKALTTCVEHLILVAIFYFPLLIIFMIGFYQKVIEPDQRVLSLSMASCIPPCVNPIVYSLQTKEIRCRVLTLVRKVKIGIHEPIRNHLRGNKMDQ